jgi:chromosome segregation ATPase
MKRTTAPIWLTLAVAASPLVRAENAPAQAQPAPAPTAAVSDADVLAGLQKNLDTINRTIRDARKEASDTAAQRDAARTEATALREAKLQLEQQLNGLKQQLGASNQEISRWKDKAGVLEKKLGAGEEAYAKLATFRDEMNTAMKEFAALKGGLAEVRGELQAPAERVALKKEVESLKATNADLAKRGEEETKAHAGTRQKLTSTENALSGLKEAFAKLTADAKAKTEELAKAIRERSELTAKLDENEKAIAAARNDAEGLKKATVAVTKERDEARNQLTAKTAENEKAMAAARTEAEGLKKAAATVTKERDDARGSLAETRDALAQLQKEAAQLRGTVGPLAAEIKAAKEQTELATAAIREANVARKRAEDAQASAQKELASVKGELASAVTNRDELKQQIAAKTTEIDSLRKTVEELNARTAQQEKAKAADEKSSAGL